MNKHAMAIAALALALCFLLAGCGGQGALPVSPDAPPPEISAQSSEADGTSPAPPEQPEASGPEEAPPPEEEDPEKSENPEKEETPTAPQDNQTEPPKEDGAARSAEARKPQENGAARSAETKKAETKKWQAVTIDAAGFGIPDKPIGDPAIYGGGASLPLGKLMACALSADGAAGEDLSDELWRRFLEEPDTVLAYLVLMGDQQGEYWECPAAEELCRTIACADGAWYNSVEFGEALAACRQRYPAGRRAELLDLLEEEHAASLERNGWQGAEPEHAPPREIPLENRWAVSVDLADYGLTRTLKDPRFEYIFNHTETVPLDQLIVFDLWGDALTEGSSEELRSRFLEDPDTVLAFLALMGDQVTTLPGWEPRATAELVCRRIASADAAWHGGSEEFARTLAACRAAYPGGRVSELLDVLEQEHAGLCPA